MLKRIFGALITILGIGGLIYAFVVFADDAGDEWKLSALYGIPGFIFIITGIGLIKTTLKQN